MWGGREALAVADLALPFQLCRQHRQQLARGLLLNTLLRGGVPAVRRDEGFRQYSGIEVPLGSSSP